MADREAGRAPQPTPGPWDIQGCQPHPGDGPNSLPRWSLFHEEYPDTTGKVGTGIVSYSRSTFAYLSADEVNARLIVESVNQHAALKARVETLEGALKLLLRGYDSGGINDAVQAKLGAKIARAALGGGK